MSDTVSGVENNSGGAAGGVQAEHSLQRHKECGHIERLEEYLGGLLPITAGVERRLCQQDGVLLGEGLQLILAARARERKRISYLKMLR